MIKYENLQYLDPDAYKIITKNVYIGFDVFITNKGS